MSGAPSPTRAPDPRLDAVFPSLYAELARLARAQRRGGSGGPGTISIVHEAWAKLARTPTFQIHDRQHFLALAARVMRQVVVDHARARLRAKRGGGVAVERWEDGRVGIDAEIMTIIDVDDALTKMGESHPDLKQLVELKFFAGLPEAEIAEIMSTSVRTVRRKWARSVAHLRAQLQA